MYALSRVCAGCRPAVNNGCGKERKSVRQPQRSAFEDDLQSESGVKTGGRVSRSRMALSC